MKRGPLAWVHPIGPPLVGLLILCGFFVATGTGMAGADEGELSIQITHVDPLRGRVHFSVRESDGTPLTALEANDFEFRLEGTRVDHVRLQSFEDDSTSRLMVVMGFGSTRMTRTQSRNLVSAASRHFLADMDEAKPDRAALLTFADDVAVPAHFSADPIRLAKKLRYLKFRGQSLRFFDGLKAGHQLLHETDSMGFGVLIFASDQLDTSSQYDLLALQADIKSGGFPPVFTIGLNADSALANNLKEVSAMSGGRSFLIVPRSNLLTFTYDLILDMLQQQYVATIGNQMLEGEIEIVHHLGDGTVIAAKTSLPTNSPVPVSVPSFGSGKEQKDWRQALLLLVLAGLLGTLGALRMGWIKTDRSHPNRTQDLHKPQKWSSQKSKPAEGRRRARAANKN